MAPGVRLLMTTDCVEELSDICPNTLLVAFDLI